MDAFVRETGYGWLGNYAASGTAIIQALGDEHVATGYPIVYTSADSVFQIAAHEDVIPVEELYRICAITRERVMVGEHAVGRIIARPFVGPVDGTYVRTHRRRDFAVKPFEPTVLDRLTERGVTCYGIGKIGEIFAWQGICESPHVTDNMDGFTKLVQRVASDDDGFVFANLVDFDMLWGHRNDARGYAKGLEAVDARMPELLDAMIDGDLLIITADHGCDPTTASTDHSREYTPLIAKVKGVDRGVALGTRATFSDIGETVLDFYGFSGACGRGTSFLSEVSASVSDFVFEELIERKRDGGTHTAEEMDAIVLGFTPGRRARLPDVGVAHGRAPERARCRRDGVDDRCDGALGAPGRPVPRSRGRPSTSTRPAASPTRPRSSSRRWSRRAAFRSPR